MFYELSEEKIPAYKQFTALAGCQYPQINGFALYKYLRQNRSTNRLHENRRRKIDKKAWVEAIASTQLFQHTTTKRELLSYADLPNRVPVPAYK